MGQVDAGQLVEDGAKVKVGFIAVALGDPRAWERRGRGRAGGGQGLEFGLDGGVAGGQLCLTQVKELQVLS